ncbi:hypothetical protein [Virgibacillus salexigens]|uniref:hypothetical protein n=1 Tax=Virgibacillus salexigens TaxID=61016 RepID=UPI0019093BA7|nr:hypothetical protein [Virgibacillus salexigens]
MKKNLQSYSNFLLYISLVSIVLALLFFSILQSKESESLQENGVVSTQVRSIIKDGSQGMENKLNTIVQNTNQISKVEVYNVKDIDGYREVFDYVESVKPNFEYSRNFAFTSLFVDLLPSGNGDSNWYIVTERRSFHTLSVLVLFLGVIFYWFSFTVWSLKKAYDQNRLNIGWVIVFMLFNIIGYSIFHLANNRINSKQSFE